MRIVTVAGTRPELIKLAPLVPLLRPRFEHHYLFTGQHFSPAMVGELFGTMESPLPEIQLDVRSSDISTLTRALRSALEGLGPDLVLVYGDTNSTLAAARAAALIGSTMLHIEAGIRSFDSSMVEERNRVEVDRLAQLRLAPTVLSRWILTHLEGYPADSCPVVGNLVVDAWQRFGAQTNCPPLPAGLTENSPFALLTLHRPDTVDRPQLLSAILKHLGELPMQLLFPVHPRTQERLQGQKLPANLQPLGPLSYPSFCGLLRRASVVITDSGGVQEEAASAGRPCVTLRARTDRPESLLGGLNRLHRPQRPEGLKQRVLEAIEHHQKARASEVQATMESYGDGRAAERITALLEFIAGRSPSISIPASRGFADTGELAQAAESIRLGTSPLRVVG
ncbi:MAG: UDP-N-acetylglucosamine 2-epimerase (non-hydrolyzing) [Rickettsiales bacterium]|nr:UDP-N-acetylglucosamine 2-epimerase (non-hydrolyzing) [Rickettsiales bacterium]